MIRHFRLCALLAALMCIVASMVSCSMRKQVSIQIDFSSTARWKYLMDVAVNGSFMHGDTAENFSNTARCDLIGSPVSDTHSSLRFSIANVAIASNVIDSAEILNLTRQFEGVAMVYSGSGGELVPLDTANLPVVHIGGWDLYHTMARIVPALPQRPVAVGNSWEREKQIPLNSSLGKGVGHLYQSFKLDSISNESHGAVMAFVSWKFSYRVEFTQNDSSGLANDIPLLGSGTGHAIFNISGKYLEEAQIAFSVPRNKQSRVTMEWSEQASMRLSK
jgi:hypothetical protein